MCGFRKRCPAVIQQGITCSRSRSVQPAPIHTMSRSTTVRVRPRTQTRLYLAYRGCGRLEHRNRWSHSNRSQCECKGNRSSECLIKASHCRSKSSKCRSYGRCSSNRPRGSLNGHRRNIGSNRQQGHHHRQRRYHHPLCCDHGLRREQGQRRQRRWGGFGPSTQGEYVEQVDGSDSDNNPKDVTPPWKKQKVQTYRKHAHHKLLGKKNLRKIKKDLRGVSRCSI